MRGDLIFQKQRMANIDVYSMQDTRHIQVYRLNEDGVPTEFFHLKEANIYINHEKLEISGYRSLEVDRQSPDTHRTAEAEYRYISFDFYPYGHQIRKEPPRENVYGGRHTYRGRRVRG